MDLMLQEEFRENLWWSAWISDPGIKSLNSYFIFSTNCLMITAGKIQIPAFKYELSTPNIVPISTALFSGAVYYIS